jgi:hypothetical protein
MAFQVHSGMFTLDQFTRRIIGFGVHAGDVDGVVVRIYSLTTRFPSL